MSGNGTNGANGRIDGRILRTRDRLGDALVELIQEKPFESVTVQDLLDRAGVSRSTFYTHYRDKEDLFLSDVEEFLELTATMLSRHGDASDRVAPVREFFAHVAEMSRLYKALVASGKIHDFMELAQGHFARGIEQRLADRPRAAGLTAQRRTALSQALAGALLSLLTWWIDRDTPQSAAEMDDLFHRMVWSGVDSSEPPSPSPGGGRPAAGRPGPQLLKP